MQHSNKVTRLLDNQVSHEFQFCTQWRNLYIAVNMVGANSGGFHDVVEGASVLLVWCSITAQKKESSNIDANLHNQ
jgi:flagellar biosynthesis regulator FlbT